MAASPITQTWALASHVRACECDGNVILLDLRSSRYLGIGGPASRALTELVVGWPGTTQPCSSVPESKAADELLGELCRKGLVDPVPAMAATESSCRTIDTSATETDGADAGEVGAELNGEVPRRSAGPTPLNIERQGRTNKLEEATSTVVLAGVLSPLSGSVRIAQALRFTLCVASASWQLRRCSLSAISISVLKRRSRLSGEQAVSLDAMKPAVAAYEHLRPLLFTARARCLLDSLALVNFLARTGFAARWVVGVRLGPFAAHAWVQSGHTVLNDQHEYVRQFRPILVV